MKIRALSKNEFKSSGFIYFSNILDGFDKYEYIQLSPMTSIYEEVEKSYIKFIEKLFNINNKKLVIDFYKNRLDNNSIKYIEDRLKDEEKLLLHRLMSCGDNEDIFFEITDISYIPLLTKLNLKELFFVTFYFDKANFTLWGNYNYKFPLFSGKKENLEEIKKIAKQCSLL
ncbi:hypothetical protein E5347_05180 [Clostridium sartagoforme]|uniref:Uncharacterized protein n=1 Tax=Clostridium sartagoforme TaxID=84031 RepID=A0A4S2DSI9_9CLOT|nr:MULTISPECIES: hypothetical protein [Clostridium]MBS5937476.1 hypothetical protein [Clostridium sp.]TGY44213.1 hypothetical protein E5347_05180 [Clostridium sartagoforme]